VPSSLAIIDFIDYCGGLAKYLDLRQEINKGKRPSYEIAKEFHVSPIRLSRFLSRHTHRTYEDDETLRLIIEHQIKLTEARLAESRRNLARKSGAPILPLPDTRSGGA